MANMTDTMALEAIHELFDGEEWDAGTIELVAEFVQRTGRIIRTPEEGRADRERVDRNEYEALPALARGVYDLAGEAGEDHDSCMTAVRRIIGADYLTARIES